MIFLKNKLEKIMTNNFLIALYAFLIAVVLWFVISITIYPSTPKTINNLAVDTDISLTSAEENGLSVIDCDVKKVYVQIEGKRSQIGNLPKDDIVVKLDVNNVFKSGTRQINFKVESKSGVKFKVKKITPSSASVLFDTIETREFPLVPECPNIKFEEGKMVNKEDFSCDPPVMKISGPSTKLDMIKKCAAVTNKNSVLSTVQTFSSDEIKLYNEANASMDLSWFSFDQVSTGINITIPVLTAKTIDLGVSLTKTPPDFNKDSIKFRMSADNITLASQSDTAEFPDPFIIGQIPLGDLTMGYKKTFTIDTNDYINQSNLETVTVELIDENLAEKEFVIKDFSVTNGSPSYDFNVLTNSVTINMIGPESVINSMTSEDIVAEINLLNYDDEAVLSSSFSYPVTISCPRFDSVWASLPPKVTLSRSAKIDTENQTNNN